MRRRRPSYADRLVSAAKRAQADGRLERGAVYVVDISHDGWCPCLLGTGVCACDADVGEPRRVDAPEVV